MAGGRRRRRKSSMRGGTDSRGPMDPLEAEATMAASGGRRRRRGMRGGMLALSPAGLH